MTTQKSWLKKPGPACPQVLALQVPRGLVAGIGSLNKFGRNPDVDTGSDPEDVWDGGGLWRAPTVAQTHDIASTSSADLSGSGTGAHTVYIAGLDANFNAVFEPITMNGTSNVATANTYLRIFRMYVVTGGSAGANVGDITATGQTDATVTAQINADNGQTLMAFYPVPGGKKLYLTGWHSGINRQGGVGGAMADFQLMTRDASISNPQWRVRRHLGLVAEGGNPQTQHSDPFIGIPEKHDILVRCTSVTDNNTDVYGGFDGYLVDTP